MWSLRYTIISMKMNILQDSHICISVQLSWKISVAFIWRLIRVLFVCQPFFENREKSPLFCKKYALFVCVYGWSSHLKCSFKNILEKSTNIFHFWAFLSYVVYKMCIEVPLFQVPPLSRKIRGCTPIFLDQNRRTCVISKIAATP